MSWKLLSWNTALVVAVAAVAAGIRFWNFGSLGYSHWDEYYFIGDAQSVAQIWPKGFGRLGWYTTPLVAYTDGTLFRFLGIHAAVPFAVSALYGSASAVAVYLLGSRLFDRWTGAIAAAGVATAEFSVMFSRMALAEATFCFWLTITALFIWQGFIRCQFRYYVLAGISGGLVLNAKYDGVFPLIFATAWLGLELARELIVERPPRRMAVLAQNRVRIAGTALFVAIATLLFAPFLVRIAISPGLPTVLVHHESNIGYSLIKTPPIYILEYFWLFTSPAVLLLALLGIGFGATRFTLADRFLMLYTAGWVVAVMLFPPFPREALGLLPAAAIWAGRGITELGRLAVRYRSGLRSLAMLGALMAMAVVVVSDLPPTVNTLSIDTRGYEHAGAVARQYEAAGDRVFVHTQAVALLYIDDPHELEATLETEQLLTQPGARPVLMTDQTVSWHPNITAFFDLNRDHLTVLDRIPNGMYDEVLLQPATDDRLAQLSDPPDYYRYITFWQVSGPLRFPDSWPH